MSVLITTIHVIVCIVLIIVVLLQSGKSADLAGAFGGVGSQSVFGPRNTANILSKTTTVCAVLFMLTSIGLWIISAKETKSVVSGEAQTQKESVAVTEAKSQGAEKQAQKPGQTQPIQQQKEEKSTEKEKK
ncbi:MAG: preprotein translocase subunit SecG [Candidatus Aminicenantes bacterium]|nr:preprotein translocase subunit SecG [Candidatus Aminicenantes bacterium]